MKYSGNFRLWLLGLATLCLFLSSASALVAQVPDASELKQSSVGPSTKALAVHLHWGARSGVLRYRLQLARDLEFHDIVFDRIVNGNEYQMTELPSGNYFWRIAPLTKTLGEFSSAASIEIPSTANPQRAATEPAQPEANNIKRQDESLGAGGGWRAVIGEVVSFTPAHLRRPDRLDLVAINTNGAVFALDANNGVSLWMANPATGVALKNSPAILSPLLVRNQSRLDNLIILSGWNVRALEGSSGRVLWNTSLPAPAAAASMVGDDRNPRISVLDNSLQKFILIDSTSGKKVDEIRLSDRVIGSPISFSEAGTRHQLLAFASGRLEVRDANGLLVRAGDAGSEATTAPLFVHTAHNNLVLVGTKGGLTAMNAADLSPLGRVALKDDAPRGVLSAGDLKADGTVEVIMTTERGHVMAVNALDGTVLWNSGILTEAQTVSFGDLNGDGILDILMANGQTFALVLSGRDGSLLWEDGEAGNMSNHVGFSQPRSLVALPFGSGVMVIGSDTARSGLRAVEFPKGTLRTITR